MRCVQHPSNDKVLISPKGMEEICLPAPATSAKLAGHPCVVTYWEPTEDEMARLAKGEKVRLWIAGGTMAPVSLDVGP